MENDKEPSEETKERWIKDPNNWSWGLFYYNPEDKRIFPPKKIKEFGWTTNFANPNSVFVLLAIMAVLITLGRYLN